MNYKLIVRPEAELDLEDAFEWYESQSASLGSEFVRAIDACISSIGRNPLAYQIIHQQTRRVLVRRFPYSLLYIVEDDKIAIIACLHSKRNPNDWQDRLDQ
jgi:plasmid stabilization system protein ParE